MRWGTWVAQWLTLDFSSGHDVNVVRSSCIRLCVQLACLLEVLSLPLSLCLSYVCACSLSQINLLKK